MNDLISRQAAIDDIKAMYEWHDVVTEDRLIEHIKRLPSAQQWIPVSERLPDIHDEVLVTARGEVSIAWLYVDGKWRSNDMPQPMFKDITAWMPLPEPYKEDKA